MRKHFIVGTIALAMVVLAGAALQAMGQDAEQIDAATTTEPYVDVVSTTTDPETVAPEPAATSSEQSSSTGDETNETNETNETEERTGAEEEPAEPAPIIAVPLADPQIPQPVEEARTPVRRAFLTEEGMEIIVLREGRGDRAVKEGDIIKVAYELNVSGQHERLDPTKTGRDPFVFEVGSDKVIDGWNLGVIGMSESEIRKIHIPSVLAYGPDGNDELGVPPNTNLELRITVIKID